MNLVVNSTSLQYLNHIICETGTDVLPVLASESIDSFITDPPYNVNFSYNKYKDNLPWDKYFDWQLNILIQGARLLKPGGSLLWLNYPEISARMWELLRVNVPSLEPLQWITWIYHQHTGGKPLRKASRVWIWFVKTGGILIFVMNPLQVNIEILMTKEFGTRIDEGFRPIDYDWWYYEQVKNVSSEKVGHPCQLPLEMMLRIVQMVTPEKGLVIDPFCGSGTTLVAAKKLGKNWIGIESDETYTKKYQERLDCTRSDLFG